MTAYEQRADREAKFVYAADKLMGAITRLADNGESWADAYPEKDGSGFHRVVDLVRRKAEQCPELLPVFDTINWIKPGQRFWVWRLSSRRETAQATDF